MTLTVDFPPSLWLTANRPIANHGQKARVVRAIQALVRLAAKEQGLVPVSGPYVAAWTVRYPKGVGWLHGDAANGAPTCKAALDSLVGAGYLEGDGPRFIAEERFRRGANLNVPHVHRIVLDLVEVEG